MKVVIKEDYSIILPQEIIEYFFLTIGDELDLEINDNKIQLSYQPNKAPKFIKFIDEKAEELIKNKEKYGIGEISSEIDMLKGIITMLEKQQNENNN